MTDERTAQDYSTNFRGGVMMASCGFTYAHYREILRSALELGYQFKTFSESADVGEKSFFMRHDIDLDPYAALAMAQIEHEIGVRSTYFFLPTANYYNVQAQATREVLRKIEELGCDVQLHFDAAPFQDYSLDMLEREISRQAEWLAEAAGKEQIVSVSFHRPAARVMGTRLNRFVSAYEPRFMNDMKYVSDSAGQWREGCICAHLGKHPVIQCLIHPVWWAQSHRNVPETISAYLGATVHRFDQWLQKEIRTYGGQRGG